jgi:hypothetical protein
VVVHPDHLIRLWHLTLVSPGVQIHTQRCRRRCRRSCLSLYECLLCTDPRRVARERIALLLSYVQNYTAARFSTFSFVPGPLLTVERSGTWVFKLYVECAVSHYHFPKCEVAAASKADQNDKLHQLHEE